MYDIGADSIYAYAESAIKHVGAIYSSINGTMKKLWPDANPTNQTIIEYSSPGTYTVTLPPGYYKFSMSGAGGGSSVSYKGSSSANTGGAVAGGGAGAYGWFYLKLNVQETFTITLGYGGNGTAGGGTQHAVAGTVSSVYSNIRGLFLSLNAGTGGSSYWNNNNDKWATAGQGGNYSTTLSDLGFEFHNGNNGSTDLGTATTRHYYGYGGDNPSPYLGDGGTSHYYGPGSFGQVYANAGQNGWIKIEPALQYIYTSPITTSITLDPGTYYFEIVGGGGGGLGVLGASDYAYGNGGSGASGYGYFTVSTTGVYNVQCGSGGNGNSSEAGVTSQGTFVSGNGTDSYIIRAADNFNVVTCGGGTGVSWHYNGHGTAEYWFNYYGTGGTASTSLSGNYTLSNGVSGSGSYSHADNIVEYPNTVPTYFGVYGQGGYGRRLKGVSHQGGNGGTGMLKIYKYA